MNWVSEGEGRPAFLYSQRWRFWYACQRIERASAWNILFFALSPFNFHGLDGRKERGVGEFYSQRRRSWYAFQGVESGERVGRSVSRLWPFNFPRPGARVGNFGGSLPSAMVLLGMHSGAWEERAHEICFLFCAPAEFFQGLSGGGKGCRCFSIFSDGACGINISRSGGVSSHERGAVISVALCRRRWRFWYACQRVEKSAFWTFIYFALPQFFFRVWVSGGKGMLASLYSQRRRLLGMHASGSR